MKKLVTLLLAFLMLLTMLSAALAEEEVVEITMLLADTADVDYPFDMEERPVLKKINEIAKERFGITIKLETCITSEYATVVNTRLAAGADLPDIIRCQTQTPSDLINYYNQGLIYDLNDFAEYMPNYLAAIEPYPGVRAATQDDAGHLLAISQIVVNPQHVTSWLNINYQWLDKLGLAVPTTPEELKSVLKAFQENDMNENGAADEVMKLTDFGATNTAIYPYFGEGQMLGAIDSWGVDADGKIYNTMVTDAAREYVTYMNDLWNEGLIWDSSFSSPTAEENTQLLIEQRVAAFGGAFWDGLLMDATMNAYGMRTELAPMKPLGDKVVVRNYSGGQKYVITTGCAAPEKVATYFDWFFTTEGTQMSYYGEAAPGGDYYVRDTSKYDSLGLTATEYEMVGTDKYFEETVNEPRLNGKLGANSIWPQNMPGYADQVAADFYFGYDAEACGRNCDVKFVTDLLNWAMDNGTPAPLFSAATNEQTEVLTKAQDLFNYMDEQMKGFISGAISLDNWDAYVAQCETMGLADVIAVMQARYDAANA